MKGSKFFDRGKFVYKVNSRFVNSKNIVFDFLVMILII